MVECYGVGQIPSCTVADAWDSSCGTCPCILEHRLERLDAIGVNDATELLACPVFDYYTIRHMIERGHAFIGVVLVHPWRLASREDKRSLVRRSWVWKRRRWT